jgi:hypothetical protein
MQAFPRTPVPKTASFLLLVAWMTISISASAQQASDPSGQDEINRQLLQRVQELEKEVQRLKGQPSPSASALPPAPLPPPPPPVADSPSINEVSPRLQLNVLGDLGYEATDAKGVSNTFEIGSLDLFMTSRLSDRLSLLGEILFIAASDNSISPDVERLVLQYKASDRFAFGIGRYHTSIGYYNTAFHHGAWFETAIGRPFMYAFDDEGGVLPMQEVGVTTFGQIPSGKLRLHYVFEVGNGRSHLLDTEPAQNAQDGNNGKSVNVALFARPSQIQGLEVGFSIYHDYLTFSDNINHSELISTAHVVFTNSNYELLNEAMVVRHTGSSTGAPGAFHTPAFYTQLSRKFGSYRPYFRYQYMNAGVNEPIYGDPTDGQVVGRRNGASVGMRYDITENAAFKLQYDRMAIRGLGSSNGLDSQFAFTF